MIATCPRCRETAEVFRRPRGPSAPGLVCEGCVIEIEDLYEVYEEPADASR